MKKDLSDDIFRNNFIKVVNVKAFISNLKFLLFKDTEEINKKDAISIIDKLAGDKLT